MPMSAYSAPCCEAAEPASVHMPTAQSNAAAAFIAGGSHPTPTQRLGSNLRTIRLWSAGRALIAATVRRSLDLLIESLQNFECKPSLTRPD